MSITSYEEKGISNEAQWELMRRSAEILLRDGRKVIIRVYSESMLPTLRAGQLLSVLPLEVRSPKLGDVILRIQCENRYLMVHRLMFKFGWKGKTYFVTKADSSIVFDDIIDSTKVVGTCEMKSIEKGLSGVWFKYLQSILMPLYVLASLFYYRSR